MKQPMKKRFSGVLIGIVFCAFIGAADVAGAQSSASSEPPAGSSSSAGWSSSSEWSSSVGSSSSMISTYCGDGICFGDETCMDCEEDCLGPTHYVRAIQEGETYTITVVHPDESEHEEERQAPYDIWAEAHACLETDPNYQALIATWGYIPPGGVLLNKSNVKGYSDNYNVYKAGSSVVHANVACVNAPATNIIYEDSCTTIPVMVSEYYHHTMTLPPTMPAAGTCISPAAIGKSTVSCDLMCFGFVGGFCSGDRCKCLL